MNNREFGIQGEKIAADYLLAKNYKILKCNYKIKLGEIDLIAKKGSLITFVEVKTRKSLNYGVPSQAVNWKKQRKIIQVAQVYISTIEEENYHFSFDIIEVVWKNNHSWDVNHIINGFEI
ncbi:YraN family protein [Anaerosinus gibii]|uniref:UPF0102 protein P3F81_05910 n=1 Tax=Selenobaculum gibii TaxID=3054208 RepID=A0A9Y2AKT4_9FIRM|nr:YraN family protein [Selenobaculum gbiensis]WIW71826.1 YraN family protein [Selenobaculum gbiensis]